jgi:hypothetical protein
MIGAEQSEDDLNLFEWWLWKNLVKQKRRKYWVLQKGMQIE